MRLEYRFTGMRRIPPEGGRHWKANELPQKIADQNHALVEQQKLLIARSKPRGLMPTATAQTWRSVQASRPSGQKPP
jgi:hypothetical protein